MKPSTVIALAGIVLAWFWSKRTSDQLTALAQSPGLVLPSRQIGSGFVGPIAGFDPRPISAPMSVDEHGQASAPYGTDLVLGAIDPYDPGYMATLPGQAPRTDPSVFQYDPFLDNPGIQFDTADAPAAGGLLLAPGGDLMTVNGIYVGPPK